MRCFSSRNPRTWPTQKTRNCLSYLRNGKTSHKTTRTFLFTGKSYQLQRHSTTFYRTCFVDFCRDFSLFIPPRQKNGGGRFFAGSNGSLIHAPARGSDYLEIAIGRLKTISIHAFRKGGDSALRPITREQVKFLSAPSKRGATPDKKFAPLSRSQNRPGGQALHHGQATSSDWPAFASLPKVWTNARISWSGSRLRNRSSVIADGL